MSDQAIYVAISLFATELRRPNRQVPRECEHAGTLVVSVRMIRRRETTAPLSPQAA
jgi:hypothetical protein